MKTFSVVPAQRRHLFTSVQLSFWWGLSGKAHCPKAQNLEIYTFRQRVKISRPKNHSKTFCKIWQTWQLSNTLKDTKILRKTESRRAQTHLKVKRNATAARPTRIFCHRPLCRIWLISIWAEFLIITDPAAGKNFNPKSGFETLVAVSRLRKNEICNNRSQRLLWGPTSSLQPFGPAWLRPSRPSGAQAVDA